MAGGQRRWLLLDLAGVLLRFEPALRRRRLCELSGLGEAEVQAHLDRTAIGDRLDDGRAATPELSLFLSDLARRPVAADEAWSIWLLPFAPDARVIATLPTLARDWRLGVFTNNAAAIARVFNTAPFERMFFSAELGVRKPAPESFRRVAALLDVPPGDITFVDDGAANVDAARALGWRAALFPKDGDLAAVVAAA